MPRVVFDTVVFVRSLINPSGIWGSLIFRHYLHYQVFVSPPIVTEILEVLHRPELTRKFRSLQSRDIHRVITLLSQASVVHIPSIPNVSRDPKDDKFLATAVAGDADFLVTEDTDLLVLKEYKGVKIVNTKTFLDRMKREKA